MPNQITFHAKKSYPIMIQTEQVRSETGTSCSSTSNIIVQEWLNKRVWCTKFQSSLLNIYFCFGGLRSSLLFIHFSYSLNRCLHCVKARHRVYPICDAPLSRLTWRSFTLSQKSHWNQSSYVWTEALSCMINIGRARATLYPVHCEHSHTNTTNFYQI